MMPKRHSHLLVFCITVIVGNANQKWPLDSSMPSLKSSTSHHDITPDVSQGPYVINILTCNFKTVMFPYFLYMYYNN